ncbi:hypothetical protein [Nonomuraea sp. NPDC001699]
MVAGIGRLTAVRGWSQLFVEGGQAAGDVGAGEREVVRSANSFVLMSDLKITVDLGVMHILPRTAAAVGAAIVTATLISVPAQAAGACPEHFDRRQNRWINDGREGDFGIPNGPGSGIYVCRNGVWARW